MRPQPGGDFAWTETAAGPALVCRPLAAVAVHLFTTRSWTLGNPDLGVTEGSAWAEVAAAVRVPPAELARLQQVHGAAVVVKHAGTPLPTAPRPAADIVISNDPASALAIQTADCVPLLIADARSGAVGAAHAGWRGLAARVPSTAIAAMTAEFGSQPRDLVVAIGPSISAERYEVGHDVFERFEAAGFAADRCARWFRPGARADHWQFDGWQSARDQLEDAGVPADRIHLAALCTATYADLFCSYRRDGQRAGRMAAGIRRLKSEV